MKKQAKAYDLSRVSMLVIDDNKHMQLMLKEILRAFNIRNIQTADDGADALKILSTYPTDLILCDWNMKPFDGLEFLQMVRRGSDSADPFVPVIMLTGHTEYHRVLEARDAGANDFLSKPVAPAELYNRIVRCIELTRPHVKTRRYVGPCRRRGFHQGQRPYEGKERRNVNPVPSDAKPEEKVLSQAEIEAMFN